MPFGEGSSLGKKMLMGKKGKCREAEPERGVGSPAPCMPPGHSTRMETQPHTLPSPRPSLSSGGLASRNRQDTKPQSHATLGRETSSTRQEPGTVASERSPRAAVPVPSDTAPRGGEAGFSSGAMPQNRPLLLEARAHRPPPRLCWQGHQASPVTAACVTLAPSGSRRSVLPVETRLDQALSVPVRFKGLFWGFLQLVV